MATDYSIISVHASRFSYVCSPQPGLTGYQAPRCISSPGHISLGGLPVRSGCSAGRYYILGLLPTAGR